MQLTLLLSELFQNSGPEIIKQETIADTNSQVNVHSIFTSQNASLDNRSDISVDQSNFDLNNSTYEGLIYFGIIPRNAETNKNLASEKKQRKIDKQRIEKKDDFDKICRNYYHKKLDDDNRTNPIIVVDRKFEQQPGSTITDVFAKSGGNANLQMIGSSLNFQNHNQVKNSKLLASIISQFLR